MTITKCVAGCDVSKSHVDVCLLSDDPNIKPRTWRVENDQLEELARELKRNGCKLVVFEASGGYERPLHQALAKVGVPASRVNPRNARNFAKGLGLLAKTDRLDAAMLAEFARRMEPKPTALPTQQQSKFRDLVHRRSQLVGMLSREKQSLAKTNDPDILDSIKQMIVTLETGIKAIQHKIRDCVRDSADLTRRDKILRSMPGVGPVLASVLLARLPELGTISRRKIAALVGLAPYACDSGHFKGTRHIWGGRADIRQAMYMGAVSVITREGRWKQIYEQLKDNGKAAKVALIAVMRRMLTTLNEMVRYDAEYSIQHGC